jgi:DNA-binding GntR family transcriptional regulator
MAGLFENSSINLPSRTSASIAKLIRREILAGTLKPDQPLLEREIASELEVSRTPVREALFVLQGEGLVELVPRRYARVRRITDINIKQIYSLRRLLEIYAAENAALYAEQDDITDIETTLLRQKNLPKGCSALEQAEADLAFHYAVAAASNSPLLQTVTRQVLALTATLRSRVKYDAQHSRRMLGQHKKILGAIRKRDAALAAELMGEHIDESTSYVQEAAPQDATGSTGEG